MDSAAYYEWLRRLGDLHGKAGRGKILQRLLELAFSRSGYRLVDERISEGVDFDVINRQQGSDRYSFEARTSEEPLVLVRREDLDQLDERAKCGYLTGLAALQIAPGSSWIFVKRSWLLPPSTRVSLGTSPCWETLAAQINHNFDTVLDEVGAIALRHGLNGLESFVLEARR